MSIVDKYKKYQIKSEQPLSNKTFTIPNILSFLRIVLITPFVVLFIRAYETSDIKYYIMAGVIIVISGLTDFFDGFIARNFNQMSELGKILDPIGDKLTLIAVGICMIIVQPLAIIPMGIMIIKDILMLIGGAIIIKKGIIPPKSKWYGKVGTVMFYVTVAYIVFGEIFNFADQTLSIVLLSSTSAVMVFALISYIIMFFQILDEYNNSENVEKQQLRAQITTNIPKIDPSMIDNSKGE